PLQTINREHLQERFVICSTTIKTARPPLSKLSPSFFIPDSSRRQTFALIRTTGVDLMASNEGHAISR
ncbi:MAG: hypothetical protein WA796_03775, partial [Pseudolabrys sp.]